MHEAGEYALAKRIFPEQTVFFSSDYLDYKRIYSATSRYLGGRVHGATPVIATGGTAHVVYNNLKIDVLEQVSTIAETLTVSRYDEPVPASIDKKPIGPALGEWLRKHKSYWGQRFQNE